MSSPTPDITLILLAYNQQATVAQAAASCLAQSGEPIEILLSDDASSDDTGALLASAAASYRGPHQVRVNRNPHNLGIGAHLNRLVELARGELLVVAAGDDISLPDRVARVRAAWDATQRRADLIAHHLSDLDEHGVVGKTIVVDDLAQWRSAEAWVQRRPYVIGAGHAWTRRLFQRFGPLDAGVAYEDQVLGFRAVASGGALTLPEPLVQYRRGGTSARPDSFTAASVRERLRVQNSRHLAETRQLLADARSIRCGATVVNRLEAELRRQDYLASLLAAPDAYARLSVLFKAGGIDPSWRWRKFWSTSLVGLAALKHRRRASRQTG